MPKKNILSDLADYCNCNHARFLTNKRRIKKNRRYEVGRHNKKGHRRLVKKKYVFPLRKLQQIERYFLKPPPEKLKRLRNKELRDGKLRKGNRPSPNYGQQNIQQHKLDNKQGRWARKRLQLD